MHNTQTSRTAPPRGRGAPLPRTSLDKICSNYFTRDVVKNLLVTIYSIVLGLFNEDSRRVKSRVFTGRAPGMTMIKKLLHFVITTDSEEFAMLFPEINATAKSRLATVLQEIGESRRVKVMVQKLRKCVNKQRQNSGLALQNNRVEFLQRALHRNSARGVSVRTLSRTSSSSERAITTLRDGPPEAPLVVDLTVDLTD